MNELKIETYVSASTYSALHVLGGAGIGNGAEKVKKYVKDTILYDLLDVEPSASQGDQHLKSIVAYSHLNSYSCCHCCCFCF